MMEHVRSLVVDDEDAIRFFLAETLRGAGHEVITAVSGEDALERLREVPFDLALLDLKLGGRIDGSVAPDLGAQLRNLTDSGHYKLTLNLKDVNYMSSAALRELISTWKTCRRWNRGDMRLAEINPNIKKVLDLTGLSGQFMIFDTEAEAVGSF